MFLIRVKTLEGEVITFHKIESYEVIDGFLTFQDPKTLRLQRFAFSNCEIKDWIENWNQR